MNLENSLQENMAMLGFKPSVEDLVAGPTLSNSGFETRNYPSTPERQAWDRVVEIP